MKRIEDLNELEIGDWVKVYDKNEQKQHFKIGEITHKWKEANHPCFQLQVFQLHKRLKAYEQVS